MSRLICAVLIAISFSPPCIAQQQETPKLALTPTTRLAVAKNIYIKHGSGGDAAFNAIESGIEGWGRYKLVNSASEADLVAIVDAPDSDSGISVSGRVAHDPYGGPESSTTTSRQVNSVGTVNLTILDAKNRVMLWSDKEKAKSAYKQKAREDNIVEAAQQLLRRFHDHVEP